MVNLRERVEIAMQEAAALDSTFGPCDASLARAARTLLPECLRELERLEREAETREEALNFQCRVANGFRALIPQINGKREDAERRLQVAREAL